MLLAGENAVANGTLHYRDGECPVSNIKLPSSSPVVPDESRGYMYLGILGAFPPRIVHPRFTGSTGDAPSLHWRCFAA